MPLLNSYPPELTERVASELAAMLNSGANMVQSRLEEDPGLVMINNMMLANKIRDIVRAKLRVLEAKRYHDFNIRVDYARGVADPNFGFKLRVFAAGDDKNVVLALEGNTQQGLLSEVNWAKLLILFNS